MKRIRSKTLIVSLCFAVVVGSVNAADWLSVPDAPVADENVKSHCRAADGTSWFFSAMTNVLAVKSAKWTVSGLGVFDVYVNGTRVGDDFLKPGFTHYAKTKYAFAYDVTDLLKREVGEVNDFAAEVGAGWWRDRIVNYKGRKSAFRGVLEIEYDNGERRTYGTNPADWRCGVAGPVLHSGIFDGEEYDARIVAPVRGEGLRSVPEINTEFSGEVLPTAGAEICLRRDLAMYRGPFRLKGGERLVVDFGQNCAAVPEFKFRARPGTKLTALPAEMLNDANKGERGCDGPKGSVYRANLRIPDDGMMLSYVFSGSGIESYLPRFTFFGYRYLSLSATDDVEIEEVASNPVSSIRKDMELGSIETGVPALNRLIANVRWGQLSNYLSVPTDCPQRNERLGWCADTQVFAEAGAYNADTRGFFRKWMRDMRDCQDAEGGFPSVAPYAQYGNEHFNLGWADAGVIVPYRMWTMFGDAGIVRQNFEAMLRFVRAIEARKYDFEDRLNYIYADWLSYQKYETSGNAFGGWAKWQKDPDAQSYRRFLAACYWKTDAEMLAEMAAAIGRTSEAEELRQSAAHARSHLRATWIGDDGLLLPSLRDLQTACLFALKCGIVEGSAKEETKRMLRANIGSHDGCLQTGFLGTSVIMDVLTESGMVDLAYDLLLNRKCPSWLYSVDQGATTIWERWNSYTKDKGFGPVGMNSFNHYAYGAVLAWIYKTVAGIATEPKNPGFGNIILSPKPDRRLGHVTAEYRSAAGLIRSAWRYEGEKWIWEFTIPNGATALVSPPDGRPTMRYDAGTHLVVCALGESGQMVRGTSAHASDLPELRLDWAGGPWRDRMNEMVRKLKGSTLDFVVFGDSIMMGWMQSATNDWKGGQEVWNRHWGKKSVANLGMSGDRTEHLLWRIERDGQADGWRAKVIFVMIGINNATQKKPDGTGPDSPETCAKGMSRVVDSLVKRHPESKIVILGAIPYPRQAAWVRAYNSLISRQADGVQVFYRDSGEFFLRPDGNGPDASLFKDGLHPNPSGYDRLAVGMDRILADMKDFVGTDPRGGL